MAKAWDGRCRKWYADRFDFKTNMVRHTSISILYGLHCLQLDDSNCLHPLYSACKYMLPALLQVLGGEQSQHVYRLQLP